MAKNSLKKIGLRLGIGCLMLLVIFLGKQFFEQSGARSQPLSKSVSTQQLRDGELITAYFNDQSLQIEVVTSPELITLGLSGRPQLGADGMLFILPETAIPQFWMKEMLFDLDMVWLRDWVVVEVTENVPAPNSDTPLQFLPIYAPKQSANMVLEIQAGKARHWGILPEARLEVK